MTRIGFITTSLTGGNSVRGVGFYTKHLFHALQAAAADHNFTLVNVTNPADIPTLNLHLLHYPYFDLFYPTLKLFPNIKTVVTVHDVIPLEYSSAYPAGFRGRLHLLTQQASLSQAAAVITDSYASVYAIHRFLGVPHSKLKLVYLASAPQYHPLAKSKLTSVARKYHLPSKFILYVGDVNYNKNLPSLVEVAIMLKTPLVIVGKQAVNLPSLQAQIPSSLSHPRNFLRNLFGLPHPQLRHLSTLSAMFDHPLVIRTGFVSDSELTAIYNLATVYCQPSFAEGFGLPVLEAMASGTPVACSKTHSLLEIAGQAAVYFDPYNKTSMESALTSVLQHPSTARRLSTLGLAQASKFSWAKTAQDTLQVYREIL